VASSAVALLSVRSAPSNSHGKEATPSAADEAARLARETGQSRWALAADLAKATAAGERGHLGTARALADQAEAELLPIGAQAMLALVQFARALRRRPQSVLDGFEQLERILDPTDVAYHPFVGAWAPPDIIEAAARSHRPDAARSYFAQLSTLTAQTSAPYLRAGVAYVSPLLAPDDEADRLYRTALGTALSNWPCFRGRLLLNQGRWLRRQRRVAYSRPALRAAKESFDALGFDGLAEIARQELRASGEPSIRRTPDAGDRLTPHELQIAQLAAKGMSNREIGQQLYISHRTVAHHLYRIFPKLGITSRSQLHSAMHPLTGSA
jgi:DNA-binding CsgD family transcriptional regulator